MRKVFAVGVLLVGLIGILFLSSVSTVLATDCCYMVVDSQPWCFQAETWKIDGKEVTVTEWCSTTAQGQGASEWYAIPGGWCEDGECVPEASTLVLFATGLLGLAGYLGLRRKEK